MPTPTALTRSIDALRAHAGELVDQARTETREQLARMSGRGAGWVDEAADLLTKGAVSVAAQLTDSATHRATRLSTQVSTQVAVTVAHWSGNLADRMVCLGEKLSNPAPGRD